MRIGCVIHNPAANHQITLISGYELDQRRRVGLHSQLPDKARQFFFVVENAFAHRFIRR
jgi:hypothetical protein